MPGPLASQVVKKVKDGCYITNVLLFSLPEGLEEQNYCSFAAQPSSKGAGEA